MNIEDFRDYCLSLGDDVIEKTPFGKFAARYDSLLVFYTRGHMFCIIDIDNFSYVNVRSTPDEIEEIRMNHVSVNIPINRSLRYWLEIQLGGDFSDKEIYALVKRSFDIIREKYSRHSS